MLDAALGMTGTPEPGAVPNGLVTERLRSSEARLRLAIHGAGMGTWDIDWNTGEAVWSKTIFSMLGLPEPAREEASARLSQWWSLVHEEDLPALEAEMRTAAEQHTLFAGEYRIRRADSGAVCWLSSYGRFYYDGAGRPTRFVGIAFDISERRQAEERFKQTHERLATALRAPHIVLFSQDRDLRYTWIHNPGLGYRAADVVGKTDHELFERPEDVAMLDALKRSVMATGQPLRQEVVLHKGDGSITYDLTLEAQRDQSHTITGVLGVAVDVTANKRAAAALAESEARLRLALEAGSLGVWSLDLGTDQAERSLRHDQIFGYAELQPDWGLRQFLDHVLPEDRPATRAAYERSLAQRADLYLTCRIRRVDGATRWIEVQGSPLCANGRAYRMIGIVGDVTERKEAEAAVAANRNELARLNQQKDKFFSIIAHDLRGPLGTVTGFAEILTQDAARLSVEEIADYAGSMLESCRHLYDLLENLLRWSRIQMGEGEVEPERFSLRRLAEQARTLASEAAGRKQIAVELAVEDDIVMGDREAAATVLRNLVSNAVKFTPTGGRIRLAARLLETQPTQVQWTVSDSGVGMEPMQIKRLFELNGRHRTKGTAGEAGSGLGLHLCRELVQGAGGDISVQSTPGQGTQVRFSLPVTVEEAGAWRPAAAAPSTPSAASRSA